MDPQPKCPGCGLELPPGGLPYDGYFHCSKECWAVFTEVLAIEYGNAVLFGQVHQQTVDAYAVQHAGGPHPDKSMGVHLVGLHLHFERGIASPDIPPHLQALARAVDSWPHFEPPRKRGDLTVLEVALADSPVEHARLVREWARGVWEAWAPHHEGVGQLARLALAAR